VVEERADRAADIDRVFENIDMFAKIVYLAVRCTDLHQVSYDGFPTSMGQ
jgi:hypothetical protein